MSKKCRYFVIISHCILNPATRVHILGRRFLIAEKICDYFLSKHIAVIQLPCPEFTAMGYWRNPQGRQQYDNVFFREHCKRELKTYVDMIQELINNDNTLFCYVGVQGSPTCSIHWGKHKLNKYKTESIMEREEERKQEGEENETNKSDYGIMTQVLDEMLKERGITIPYLEAPVKESEDSDRFQAFFHDLDDLLNIPREYGMK